LPNGTVAVSDMINWLEKQGRDKEINNFDVLPGLYKCVHRMFSGTHDGKLLFEVGNIYKCLSKHDRAEFEISYGHSVYLEDPVVCKHFIPFEKQGKPNNKVEPKFKVGDWITNSIETVQITGYDIDYGYQVNYKGNLQHRDTDIIEKEYSLWTIGDAKDGDALTYKNDDIEWFLIYKNIIPESCDVPHDVLKYHALYTGADFYDSGIAGMISENYASCFTPATKEQRDVLMKAMTVSGYEWDAKMKELRKIKQNSVNTVKSKFKQGDWIIFNGLILHIDEVVDGYYRTTSIGGIHNSYDWDIDNIARLWTIQDAKDGDVLASGDWVFIFRNFHINGCPKCHCHYDLTLDEFKVDTDSYMAGGGDDYPATKEQRKFLFQKMKEAGYVWDSEKKELSKIEKQVEQKSFDKVEPKFKVGDWIISKYMHLVMQILNNDNESYKTVETDGTERNDSYDFIERNFKLWSIQDANDGDVLNANGAPFIYKKHDKDYVYFYCGVNLADEFIEANEFDTWNLNNKVYPASKKQRELLFSKM
jgi:hypothetical protein